MRTTSLLLVMASIPLTAQVSPVAFSGSNDVVPAFDVSGPITLPVTRRKIDIAYPHGKKERSELTVVYDPKSGHYLWHVAPPMPNMPDDTGFRIKIMKAQKVVQFADPAGLVDFEFGDGLGAKVWKGHADTLDAAVSASMNEVQQGLAVFEGSYFYRDYKYIPVFGPLPGFNSKFPPNFKPIPGEFVCEQNKSAICPTNNNSIASISKQGSNWRLVLRNRWDEEVIVDQNLDLVSMQQLTQPKQ